MKKEEEEKKQKERKTMVPREKKDGCIAKHAGRKNIEGWHMAKLQEQKEIKVKTGGKQKRGRARGRQEREEPRTRSNSGLIVIPETPLLIIFFSFLLPFILLLIHSFIHSLFSFFTTNDTFQRDKVCDLPLGARARGQWKRSETPPAWGLRCHTTASHAPRSPVGSCWRSQPAAPPASTPPPPPSSPSSLQQPAAGQTQRRECPARVRSVSTG